MLQWLLMKAHSEVRFSLLLAQTHTHTAAGFGENVSREALESDCSMSCSPSILHPNEASHSYQPKMESRCKL